MSKTSKDGRVVFYEDTHTYYLDDKIKLTSITKYISKFKSPYDSDKIATAYAKKNGLKKEDVLKIWKDKGDKSRNDGTFVHSIFEDYILGNHIQVNSNPKCQVALLVIDELFKTKKLTPVETEFIVYNEKYAGQIDCIAKNNKGEYFIIDWKTNETIKTENRWQRMLGKYDYLDCCSFNHYSIQLDCYKNMCTEYDIKDCYIVHIDIDSYNIIKTDKILK
jgi:hypothetical protein